MPFKIAIVDGTRIQKESKTFLTIVELEKRLLDEANADLSEKYKKLHALFKDSKNPNHSAQERQNYKKQFNSEFAILEPQIQKKKEEKKRQIAVITARINEEVTAVTHALAKKYKLDLILNTHVFDKITVFYASPTIDLTNEAIQALDKKMPELVAWLAKQ
ncbi:MAG: OmpH family outer membrane protein [Holosporales bacterium]|nr:OmpH family outer membrane protein [Holosporales bacterium]